MTVILAFFNFLLYRVLSSALFEQPLSLWAAALCAIFVTAMTSLVGVRGLVWASHRGADVIRKPLTTRTALAVLGTVVASWAAAWLITYLLSEPIFSEISRWSVSNSFFEQPLVRFFAMITVPIAVQMFLVLRQIGKIN